ncbi:unnamed protein product [Heterobilharzia americana]|nr:unnamed protein product [Heterobilharzia americana]
MNSENLNKEQNLQLQVSLTEAFLEVKKRVGQSIETLEPLAIEDRDLEKLNTFLYAKASTPIPLNNLKQLIVCTLVHNPFIRYSLQALVGKVNEPHHPALHHNFVNPLDALVEERSGSANYTFGLSKHNASRAQTNQIGCTTTGSISSAENIPSNPSWPCSSDTITTGDNFANKPCFLRLNTRCPSIPLNQFTVSDVCQLFASITDIHPSNMHTYLTRIKQLKINGIILSVCNLEKLQQELLINSTDWQLIHKLLTCLRSSTNDGFSAFSENSQQPVRGPSLHEFEVNDSTAGSNNTFKTKTQQPQHHLSNHTSITSVLSLNSDKLSQSSDSKLKKPNHFLVRQTPWLISPKIPLTSLTSNGKSLEPFQEFPYQQHPSPDSSDQQNSCSAMEEPESLWKTSSLLHVRTNLNKNSLGQQQENRLSVVNEKPNILSNSNPFSNMENLSGSKEIKAPEKHFNKSQLTSSVSGGTAMPRYTFNKDIQKSLQSNWFAIKNGYASRSSVDLRTVFGPEQKPTSSSQLFGNCKAIRNSKRHRVKKALVEQHRRRQQQCLLTPTPNFSYVTDPGFCPAGFVCPVSNPGANLYNQELMNCTSLRYDPDLQNLRLPSLRRVIKQPRHKYDYKTFVNNATIINNVDKNNACGSGNVSPINNLGPNKAQIKQNCIYEAANNNSTDTDDTIPSSDNKSSQLNFCSRNKVFLDHLKQYPHAFHGPAVFSSPALTPSQLASLQTYAAWSTKMNPYFTNPTVLTNIGSVLPSDVNNAWKSYLQQHQPNISLLMKTNTHQKSNHKAFKPSQKKRPRKTNSEDEKTIIDQTTEFSSSCLMNPHTNSMPVPSDSEAEMCTCDYWYEVEKAREKFTISEPSLRGESDLISVDDFVLENGSQ